MANTPFSPEQLQRLTEISKLPPEEQKRILPDFLKTLSPDQIKYLQEQQGQAGKQGSSCPFCLIVQKQLPATVLYEDALVMAVLEIRPAAKGHTLVFPKTHMTDFSTLSEEQSTKLFTLGAKLSAILEELEGCEGSNLFVANGSLAGQTVDHALLHVIPRYKDDGVSLTWQGKPASQESLQQLQQQIAPQLSSLQQKTPVSQPTTTSKPIDMLEEVSDEPFADF